MSETPLYIILPDEARVLVEARQVLAAVEKRTRNGSWQADGVARAYDLGRVGEACDVAEDTVFNVLNTASSFGGCRVSANAIDRAAGRVPRHPEPVIGGVAAPGLELVAGGEGTPEVQA